VLDCMPSDGSSSLPGTSARLAEVGAKLSAFEAASVCRSPPPGRSVVIRSADGALPRMCRAKARMTHLPMYLMADACWIKAICAQCRVGV
jgi:hypothetical protein